MNYSLLPSLLLLVMILVIVFTVWTVLYGISSSVETINQLSCEDLLTQIQSDGMKPNYQYDVRAWIANECWK